MLVLLFLLLPPSNGDSIKSGTTSAFSGATSRTVWNQWGPSKAIDGSLTAGYASAKDSKPQWLNLALARHQLTIDKVVIFNRYVNRTR